MIKTGKFKERTVHFTQVSNFALRDTNLSLKAKGLYALIQSYITIPNFTLYKTYLVKQCKEGKGGFDTAWQELKEKGYLVQYKLKDAETKRFVYEYELLDEPMVVKKAEECQCEPQPENPYMEKPDMEKPCDGNLPYINNIDINNIDINNTNTNNTKSSSITLEEPIAEVITNSNTSLAISSEDEDLKVTVIDIHQKCINANYNVTLPTIFKLFKNYNKSNVIRTFEVMLEGNIQVKNVYGYVAKSCQNSEQTKVVYINNNNSSVKSTIPTNNTSEYDKFDRQLYGWDD